MHIAATFNADAVVELLLENGADQHATDTVRNGKIELLCVLILNGRDILFS